MGCCHSTKNVNNPKGLQDGNRPIPNQDQTKIRTLNHIQRTQRPITNIIQGKDRIDTPLITEDNLRTPHKDLGNQSQMSKNGRKNDQDQAKPKVVYYFDVSPKVQKKDRIYKITNVFPVSMPYSTLSQWQTILSKSQQFSEEDVAVKILQLRNRNWIQEQIKLQTEIFQQSAASLESLKIIRKSFQLREHFSWQVWAVAQYYFSQKSFDNTYGLPKTNSKQWNDGFEYKGVFIRVLPYEEAYFVLNEIKALRYVQTELQELLSMSTQILTQYGSQKENLHQTAILPLISAISCGGFVIYGTPVIYTQEIDQAKDFYKERSKVFGLDKNTSLVQNQNSLEVQTVNQQTNQSFSYLHNNIQPQFVSNSLFNFMPILKNIDTRHMIPIIDFEEYNSKMTEKEKESVSLNYMLMNLFDIIPKLHETSASSLLLRFPVYINDEISFHQFPSKSLFEIREMTRLIQYSSDQDIHSEEDDIKVEELKNSFTKKYFNKHGWNFALISMKGQQSENKRASGFYQAQDMPIRKKGQVQNDGILFLDDYQLQDQQEEEEDKTQQQTFYSPAKHSIFQRLSSLNELEGKIMGNALVSAYNYQQDFKLKYSMCNHTFSTNIETLFSVSIDQVVKIIELSDNIYNSQSIKDLLHRKGLNHRFLWAVLTKLRQNSQRDQVMIDILIRVMRKIINEEIKLKSRIQITVSEGGNSLIDEIYQGNHLEDYKDILSFYMNTMLKKKVQKNKQVFDETLLGLFLSRMKILGILYKLTLKKEEYFYLESKDILEDIIDAPSRNPVYFINAVQAYFKIDFKQDITRVCRQDKHLFLSKGQPIQKGDIKLLQLKLHQYTSIKEQAYFILARQITNSNPATSSVGKLGTKIKTKTDKDRIKQSFQRPRENDLSSNLNSSRMRNGTGIGPVSISQLNESLLGNQDVKTDRVKNPLVAQNKEQLSTIRQYQNMDKGIFNDSNEINTSKINKGQNDQIIDFSKMSKRSQFKPTQLQELTMPSTLYKLKTFLSSNPMYYFDDQSKTYLGDTLTVLQPYYEMPNIEIVDEWVMILESSLKDVYSVQGGEQVLLEALCYQALLIYFYKNDQEEMLKVLSKIRDQLFVTSFCSPETLIMIQILTGMFFEEQKDQHPIEAEKSYLTAMICIFSLYGDPRGRGNFTIPYSLYLSWKLSLISLAEDKKLHDSEFAEELFDASLQCLFNHKKHFKFQQIQALINQKYSQNPQANSEMTKPTQIDVEMERLELQRHMFDIKKYAKKYSIHNYASGLPKSNTIFLTSKNEEIKVSNKTDNKGKGNHLSVQNGKSNDGFKSKSQIPQLKKKNNEDNYNEYDLDPSDIDLEVEDENRNFFFSENFKNNDWFIGVCPFQHWSLYRQQIAQILQAHNSVMSKNNQAQSQYQRQIYRDMLQKFLPKDQFYQWLIKFNPMMYQSGIQWSNEVIKNIIFSQNQQMVSSSGSSVIMSSHHNLSSSHHSLSSSQPSSAKERKNMRLGSYSQILGKEAGGINKQEMIGVLFAMGTDNQGQLGLNIITPDTQQHAGSLKVLYPRMLVCLRDEIIKEICCGHSHTLVTNVSGQVYAWGNNETGQLGLGDKAPKFVRRPILNPYLSNVQKLSAGHEHSLAITKNGELFVWGSGGLTGMGNLDQYNKPAKLEFFAKTKIAHAVCGGLHTIVVTKEGETYSWGSTEGGQLGLPQSIIQSICQGQEVPISVPQKIPKLEGIFISQVACGEAHSIAMSRDGNLYGWGQSNYGQLGLGFSSDSFEPGIGMQKSKVPEPQEIGGLKHERIQKIFCGATFTLFQTDKGDLYGCGVNDLGQLGLDTFMEEMQIATLEKAKRGKHQQTSDVTLPTRVICFQGIAIHNVACGENHSLAVSGDGMNMLWAWGMYRNGQLGLGEVTMKMNPRPVQTLCSSLIQRIACGSMHSLVLIGDSSQISTYSSQYYTGNESIQNYWSCDMRPLALGGLNYEDLQDDEVPDDGEGRIKNPK